MSWTDYMKDKKPRKAIVNIHINDGDSIQGEWSQREQKLSMQVFRDGKNISAEKIEYTTLYERTRKPKILNKVEFKRSSEFTVSHSESLRNYNQIWAIDTNKKEIFGQVANVSAVTVCDCNGSEEYYPVLAIIFGLTKDTPELFGWRKFIEFVTLSGCHNPSHRYGLVVDSDFLRIAKINNKELPIHGSFFLPANWTLIYATSDSGKECIFNKILSESDKASSKILDMISGLESNAKHWNAIVDEEQHQPAFLPLVDPNA